MIQDTHITNAIVPIFCDGEFRGTGFIYRSYLITAAHVIRQYAKVEFDNKGCVINSARVVQNYNTMVYKQNDVFHAFNYEDIIYSNLQYGDGRVFFSTDVDVAIFKIAANSDCFELFNGVAPNESDAYLFGFHYNNKDNIELRSGLIVMSDSYSRMKYQHITQENCFFCTGKEGSLNVVDGYSGGPILNGNTIYGMLLGNYKNDDGQVTYHLMKSSSILNRILDYESQLI